MKNLIALILILSSIIIIVKKRVDFYNKWDNVQAKTVNTVKVSNNTNLITYEYQVNSKMYQGTLKLNDEKEIPENLKIYFNKQNPELSVEKLPINYEDYLLTGICLIGGIYLYLFNCESCEIKNEQPSIFNLLENIPSMKIIKVSRMYD